MNERTSVPPAWRWFEESRFGVFIHWGPAAAYGRGEQALLRERMDQKAYAKAACRWNPRKFDPDAWAGAAREAGFRFSVLTARNPDGYCLWRTATTDYAACAQAPGRDLFGAYVKAFRDAGLRVGVAYSLADWRLAAYWRGPGADPAAWRAYRAAALEQIRELLTQYGPLDLLWLDDADPHTQEDWGIPALLEQARDLQPAMLVGGRCGAGSFDGDFRAVQDGEPPPSRGLWATVRTPTWRHRGYARGERWFAPDLLLDHLVAAASGGGNLLLTVGPKANGALPLHFVLRMAVAGKWLKTHGEAIYDAAAAAASDFLSYGRLTQRDRNLYLIIRFWDRRHRLALRGLKTPVRRAVLLATGQEISFRQDDDTVELTGLPRVFRTLLFPVIRLECAAAPEACEEFGNAGPEADRERLARWASARGEGLGANGNGGPGD